MNKEVLASHVADIGRYEGIHAGGNRISEDRV